MQRRVDILRVGAETLAIEVDVAPGVGGSAVFGLLAERSRHIGWL